MAAILSLNGAKNNPKIVTKKSRRSGQREGGLAQAPPKYATALVLLVHCYHGNAESHLLCRDKEFVVDGERFLTLHAKTVLPDNQSTVA